MNEQKVENWDGYDIRFVGIDNEWYAVASDIAKALGLTTYKLDQRLDDDILSKYPIKDSLGRTQMTTIINEYGIYDAIFSSRKPKAKTFKKWVYGVIKQLRQSTGLEGFEVFRMMDKKHQREAMKNLHDGIHNPVKVSYIKANAIANKAISNKYGYPKMIKKSNMSPNMLKERESVLNDTVDLMKAKDKFNLNISISDKIYSKYSKTSIK